MRKILFALTLTIVTFTLYANPNEGNKAGSGFNVSRLVYGGQIGFGVGSNDYWSIYLSPQLGYRLTDKLIVGVGVSYAYSQEKYYYISEYKQKQNQFGLNLFADFYITKRFFVAARPEIFYQNTKWSYYDTNNVRQKGSENDFIPSVVLGAGVAFGAVVLSLNYDIVQHDLTPYGDSVFMSVGVRF